MSSNNNNSFKKVKRIAIGNRNRKNGNSIRKRVISKRILRNNIKEPSPIPSNAKGFRLIKGNLGVYRMFMGNFDGTKKPDFKGGRINAKREQDIQTRIEVIQAKTHIPKKKKEDLINQIKFGVKYGEIEITQPTSTREFWFEFHSKQYMDYLKKRKNNNNNNIKNENNDNNEDNDDILERIKNTCYLGKPKIEANSNYTYNVIEMDLINNKCIVFPATFIEFFRMKQMVCFDNDATSLSKEQEFKKMIKNGKNNGLQKILDKNINDDSVGGDIFSDYRDIFGHNKASIEKQKNELAKQEALKAELKAKKDGNNNSNDIEFDNIISELKNDIKSGNYMDANSLIKNTIEVDAFGELNANHSKLGKRYKKTKTRATAENLPDFRYDNQDDEDEGNLNDFDIIDDGESDNFSDSNDSSEENNSYKMIQKLSKIDDIEQKDYDLKYENNNENNSDSDSDSGLKIESAPNKQNIDDDNNNEIK